MSTSGLYIDSSEFIPDLTGGGSSVITGLPGTLLDPFFNELHGQGVIRYLNKINCDGIKDDLYIFRKGIGCAKSIYLKEDSRVDWDIVERLYREESATVYLRAFQRYSLAIKQLSKMIEESLSRARVFVNIFATPPNSVGLLPHLDPTEFFVLQISGSKIWRFWRQPTLDEISSLNLEARTVYASSIAENREPDLVINLRAGQVMYVPRFKIHAPHCGTNGSVHLTIGIATPDMQKYYD